MRTFKFTTQFIERIQIGLRRSHDNISICPLPIDDTVGFKQPHGYFTLRIRSTGDVIDRKQLQLSAAI